MGGGYGFSLRGENFFSHQTGGEIFFFSSGRGRDFFFHHAGEGIFFFTRRGEIFSKNPGPGDFFSKAIKAEQCQ